MDRNQLSDSVFDALFERALIDNFYEEYNAIPSLEELSEEYTFSEKHDKRMKALFAQEEHKARFKRFVYISRKVAAVILIFITVLSGTLMLNPNVRAAVSETLITWHSEFVRFISPYAEIEGTSMVPSYIPIGFQERVHDVVNYSTLILYVNEIYEMILFEANRATGTLYIDNENVDYEVRNIDGVVYHVLKALNVGEENSLVWEIDGWRYYLRSTIYVEYLQIMALSLVQNR